MHHRSKKHTLINKQGELIEVNGLAAFARDNEISVTGLSFLVNGRVDEYKGYRLASESKPVKVELTEKASKELAMHNLVMFA